MKKIILSILLLFSLIVSANEEKEYDEYAKKVPNVNDVKSLIYNWFAGFDHQNDIYWFFPFLTEDFSINFEGAEPITTKEGFVKWYDEQVKAKIEWNYHNVDSIKIDVKGRSYSPSQYVVNLMMTWDYEYYTSRNRMTTKIAQNWEIIVDDDNKLKIKKITAKVIEEPKIKK